MVAGKDNIKIGNYILILEANKSISDSKPCFSTITANLVLLSIHSLPLGLIFVQS